MDNDVKKIRKDNKKRPVVEQPFQMLLKNGYYIIRPVKMCNHIILTPSGLENIICIHVHRIASGAINIFSSSGCYTILSYVYYNFNAVFKYQ